MSTAKDLAKYALGLYQIATSPIRIIPDFMIIGAQKGGTTSLYFYLVKHPYIASAWRKELHFFDSNCHDNNFHKGLSWYRGQFPINIRKYYAEYIRKQDFITGEASPTYLFYPTVPKRVAEIFPQVKLIVLLRNPIDRAYSHYRHQVASGREKLSFEDAIACEEEGIRGDAEKMAADENYNIYPYLTRGVYVDQLQRWFRWFPREQFLIHRSEDLYTNTATIYRQTLEFLNITDLEPPKKFGVYNKARYTPPAKMDPKLRKHLVEYFEPHNLRLYELLDRDFDWKS